jgi:hypothetical protein
MPRIAVRGRPSECGLMGVNPVTPYWSESRTSPPERMRSESAFTRADSESESLLIGVNPARVVGGNLVFSARYAGPAAALSAAEGRPPRRALQASCPAIARGMVQRGLFCIECTQSRSGRRLSMVLTR